MSAFLLDASVLIAAFDESDEHHDPARSLLTEDREALMTLDFTRFEVANAATRVWRSPESVALLLDAVEEICEDGGLIACSSALVARAAELAQLHDLTVYDAAYVAASRHGARRLVSCDLRDLVSKRLAMTPAEALAQSRN